MNITTRIQAFLAPIEAINKTDLASTVAKGFLLGYTWNAIKTLGGNHFDIGTIIFKLMTDHVWTYQFLDNAFNAGILGVAAILTKSTFDKRLEEQLTTLKLKLNNEKPS
jgi:hypothetical protein